MKRSINRSEMDFQNLEQLINKYKNLDMGDTVMNLFDENNHGFGGLEFTFNDTLRSSSFSRWALGQLLSARRILQGLIDANAIEKIKYGQILKNIQIEIDK